MSVGWQSAPVSHTVGKRRHTALNGEQCARYRVLWLCVSMMVLLVAGLLVAGCGGDPASKVVSEFGSYGKAAGQFIEPNGIAVDERTGDIYVVDSNNSRVEKFTANGKFLLAWGWGVADGHTQALQTCQSDCHAGLEGPGAGQLQFAEGIAVDNQPASPSRGDVYIVDIGNHRVEKFSPTGRFLLMFGGGVNQTAKGQHEQANENLCPVKPGDVCGAGSEGPAPGQLQMTVEGSFIAVGPKGIVYLGQHNRILKYAPNGRYLAQIPLKPIPPAPAGAREPGGVSALALDAAGDLYVVRNGIIGVSVYQPDSSTLLRTLDESKEPALPEGPTPAITVDPEGQVFIDIHQHKQHRIDEYNPDGIRTAIFDQHQQDALHGITYNPHNHKLYLININNQTSPHTAHIRILTPP